MAYCSKCGAHLVDGTRFCVNCGTKVDMPPAQHVGLRVATPARYVALHKHLSTPLSWCSFLTRDLRKSSLSAC